MLMFKIKHLTNLDDILPGDRVRVNHSDCEAGADNRQRLYIERSHTNPNVVIYYCHNCQDGGRFSNDKYQSYRDERHKHNGVPFEAVEVVTEPEGLITDMQSWPTYCQVWSIKNKLTPKMVHTGGIAYDPQDDRIYIPRFDRLWYGVGKRELVGYQKRLVQGRGPKYTTVQLQESEYNYTIIYLKSSPLPTEWVIVEDYISALHIAEAVRAANPEESVGIAVNYGTKINTHMLYQMKDAGKVTVWLDNDSQHVINQAKHMADTALLFGAKANKIVDDKSDPKHYGPEEIREELVYG